MLKKLTCLFLAVLMLLSVAACQPKNPTPKPTETEPVTDPGASTVALANGSRAVYTIIVPKNCSASVNDTATRLADAIKEISGKKPDRKHDDTAKYPSTECEILLGLTEREASKEAAKELKADEYIIKWYGKKLVVLAASETLLDQAVDALMNTWSVEGKTVSLPATLALTQNLSESLLPLTQNGKFAYTLVYPNSADLSVKTAVGSLATQLEGVYKGSVIGVGGDNAAEKELEILFGSTSRKESTQAYKGLTTIGYNIEVVGKKITVAATDNDSLSRAMDVLKDILTAAKNTVLGDAKLAKQFKTMGGLTVHGSSWYASVPALTEGIIVSGYSPDAASCVLEREGTTAAGFAEYLESLEAAGFTEGEDYTLQTNKYALRHGEEATVYVSYSAKASTTRLYIEKKGENSYPARTDGKSGDVAPLLIQLSVDNKGSKQNGGMTYVIRTTTGSFIVIDGGYNTVAEADHIYKVLKDNTPAGKETVIDGWYISHLHGDHYGGMYAFSDKYSNTVDVKAFYYRVDYRGKSSPNQAEVEAKMKAGKWSDAVHYNGLQTGMEFSIGGVKLEVLHTLVDLYPVTADDAGFEFNDTSTVIKMTAGGKSAVFLGDIMDKVSLCMRKYLPQDALKADIVQYSHHAYEGAYRWVYDAIAAPTVLLPLNVVGYQETGYSSIPQNVIPYLINNQNNTNIQNRYVFSQAVYVQKVIIAGMGDEVLDLNTYVPEGDKIPNYNAYYEAHKND